ncbi:BPI fold-containing family B member 3-like [Nyctibius grandis]|uniref:BPI fold-containing family B member 3-like n=1 Tax=Nyctibius grandis TaxID=48427 RepID=UPI0035BBA31E
MSVFWAVFLLCSLLTPSQGRGIMSSLPKADVDDITDSLPKNDLQKLPVGFLGGNLPNGLPEKGGPRGRVLGRRGVLGGLLGGGDGVLGGLLGGGDGAVGGLLGGGDGVLGGLLDGDGVLGGLLDGDGVLGGLLDGDGVLGGLLDGDGVLGGLLGRDGVLDGLLGRDGLVDSLLDAVLDLLLGKNGLIGNLLGGNGGDLTGPKIVNNTLPKITLRSLPGFGHHVGFNTWLLVETTSEPGEAPCVQVEADADMLVQHKWAAPQSSEDCKTFEINVHLRPNVPLVDEPLKHSLKDALRGVGCDIVNTRLDAVSTLLGSRTPALPLGALGDLPPFSILGGDAIQLHLHVSAPLPPAQTPLGLNAGDAEGGAVAPAQGPSLPATLLLAPGHPPRLSLSPRALGVLLEPVRGGAFDLNITSAMVPDSLLLSTSALLPLIPQLARVLPGSLPLELHVRVADEPVVAVTGRRATATLKASVAVLSPALQSSQRPLFSLDTDVVLNAIPSVSDGRLRLSLALDSVDLTRAPPGLDPRSVSQLEGWLKQVLMAAHVPAINDASAVSVPLPTILNTNLRSVKVDITDASSHFFRISVAI